MLSARLMPAEAGDPEAVIEGTARVNDGDTLTIGANRIRLYGIDAVELSQTCRTGDSSIRCGEHAKRALIDLVSGETVRCVKETHDRHGRVVARCAVSGRDLGEALVAAGWATAYRYHSSDYAAAEDAARTARRGIWATEFVPPRAWREQNPRPADPISGPRPG